MNHTIRSVYWLVFVELPSTKLVPIRRRVQVRGRRLFTSESSPKQNQIKINRPRQQPRFSAPYDILNTVCLTVPSPWVANSKPARRCETAQRCNANMVLTKSGGEVNNKQLRACRQQVVHLGPVIVIFAELRLALWEKFCDLMKGQTDYPLAILLSSRYFEQTKGYATLTLSTELITNNHLSICQSNSTNPQVTTWAPSPEINPRAQPPHDCARTSTLTVTLPSGQRRTPSPKGGGRPLKTVTLASQSTRASVEFVESARKPVVPGRRRRQVGAVKFKSLLWWAVARLVVARLPSQ